MYQTIPYELQFEEQVKNIPGKMILIMHLTLQIPLTTELLYFQSREVICFNFILTNYEIWSIGWITCLGKEMMAVVHFAPKCNPSCILKRDHFSSVRWHLKLEIKGIKNNGGILEFNLIFWLKFEEHFFQ